MDILIVFNKIDILPDPEVIDKLKQEVTEIILSREGQKKESVHVHVVTNQRPLSKESKDIWVILSDKSLLTNAGEYLARFKKQLIKVFAKYGISLTDANSLVQVMDIPDINAIISNLNKATKKKPAAEKNHSSIEEFDYEKKAKQYISTEPRYSFDRVVLPEDVKRKLTDAVGILVAEDKVFRLWGLYEIQPHPSSALSFYGPSGTGKTMAAEAIAQKLGKKILKVSYADVESKYHGEGPKMVKAIFLAAERDGAVLFFDEADSLLSKRLTNVTQGSEQAINSMRSQLLISLEEFHGIVIFATNLLVNYDKAFLTRLISIEFKIPDVQTRKEIWDVHIKPVSDGRFHQLNIPLSGDVDTGALAEKYNFVGREIRDCVISACVSAALAGRDIVAQSDFINACDKTVLEHDSLAKARGESSEDPDVALKSAILKKINPSKEKPPCS